MYPQALVIFSYDRIMGIIMTLEENFLHWWLKLHILISFTLLRPKHFDLHPLGFIHTKNCGLYSVHLHGSNYRISGSYRMGSFHNGSRISGDISGIHAHIGLSY